jgi:chemotaxis family two-component system sensor kinase Cph1
MFSVRDNGIGIDARYRDQVFGLFKRLHNNSQYSGTQGRIWVESERGAGSTFFFKLPESEPA